MKISTLNQDIVDAVYEQGGERLTLRIDRNIITPAFLRQMGELDAAATNGHKKNGSKKKDETAWDSVADQLEKNAKVSSQMLCKQLIKGWDLVEDDGVTPVPVSAESFARLPPMLVTRLFTFALEQAQSVKKTMSSVTADGSAESGGSMAVPTT